MSNMNKTAGILMAVMVGLIYGDLLFSQNTDENLVLNGGFEAYDSCFTGTFDKYMGFPLKHWINVGMSLPEYFNDQYKGCHSKTRFAYGRYVDAFYAEAYKGHGYIGQAPLCLYYKANEARYGNNSLPGYMEPVLGVLKAPLQKDSLYRVSIAILSPKTNSYNVKSISIIFLRDSLISPIGSRSFSEFRNLFMYFQEHPPVSILSFSLLEVIQKRQEWIVYDTIYKAKGGEKYIFLGFYPKFKAEEIEKFKKIAERENKRGIVAERSKILKILLKRYTFYKHPADKTEYPYKTPYLYYDEVSVVPHRKKKEKE